MFNPIRRSRNIGTAKQGHGQGGDFGVPYHYLGHRLAAAERTELRCGLPLFREATLPGWEHALSAEDIDRALAVVPTGDLAGLDAIVQLQPTAKEETLKSNWGAYYWDTRWVAADTVVSLSARRPGQLLTWDRSLRPEEVRELERLRHEGHEIREAGRRFEIPSTPEAIRRTQFRTFFHEIGHHVDRQRDPEGFARRSSALKEEFAERYAEKLLGLLAEH